MSKSLYRHRLETYLKDKVLRGEPLPGIRGRVNYRAIALEAKIPYSRFRSGSESRLLVDDLIKKLGATNHALRDQPRPTLDFEVRTPSKTYGDLKTSGRHRLEDNLSKASIAPYYSHLNAFMRHFRHTDESSADEDFGVNFESRLNAFMKATGSSKAAASALRSWSRIYFELHQSTSLPVSFPAALTQLVRKSGRTQAYIARSAGIKRNILSDLMLGHRVPTGSKQVAKLEEVLSVAPGTLSSKLAFSHVRRGTKIPKEWWPEAWQKHFGTSRHRRNEVISLIPAHLLTGSLEALKPEFDEVLLKVIEGEVEPLYRQRLRKLKEKRYRLSFRNWPDQLKDEFMALIEYKSAPSGLGNIDRIGEWGEESVKMRQNRLGSFFGFLCLPTDHPDPELRGMGLPRKSLTLAWLAVQDVVKRFLDFQRLRSGGFSAEATSFITNWGALLRPQSGWLWLHPELLDRLPEPLHRKVGAAGGWENYCKTVHTELNNSLVLLKRNGLIKKNRDPMVPIAPILDHDEPLSLIDNALRQTRRNLEGRSWCDGLTSTTLAVQYRDYVMISFLARLPLRAKQLGLLTYKEDGTGYLQNHPRGGWRLLLPHKDFKNFRNQEIFASPGTEGVITLRFADFDLLKQLIPLFEVYLVEVHPILVGKGGFLFPTREGGRLSSSYIYTRVNAWSRDYLSQYATKAQGIMGVFPFGPHAFRDIVATHIIKTTGSISLAAYILLDSEKVVREHYARFLPKDRLKLAMAGLASVFKDNEDEEE